MIKWNLIGAVVIALLILAIGNATIGEIHTKASDEYVLNEPCTDEQLWDIAYPDEYTFKCSGNQRDVFDRETGEYLSTHVRGDDGFYYEFSRNDNQQFEKPYVITDEKCTEADYEGIANPDAYEFYCRGNTMEIWTNDGDYVATEIREGYE